MLTDLNGVMKPARAGGYCVGAFDIIDLEMARGVFAAAEKNDAPIIVSTAEVLLPYASLEEIADILIPMAERSPVPVCVHYDHGLTFEKCIEALKLGFTSVMFDNSNLEYEENVKNVAEMVKIAHSFGATVEAELGHVGYDGEDAKDDPAAFYTDPDQALDYAVRTGIDALAIAVGTVHGAYRFAPKLDFERITEIADKVPCELVLHGGSGLSDDDFREAIRRGITKINIFTDINNAQAEGIRTGLNEGKKAMTDLSEYAVRAVEAEAEKKIKLFAMNSL